MKDLQSPESKKQTRSGSKPSVIPEDSMAKVLQDNEALRCELAQAMEQQAATSEILRVIASSPTDLRPVLNVVAENAARLLQADNSQILRVEGNNLRVVASFGQMKAFAVDEVRPISRRYVTGRAVADRKTLHIHDLLALVETEFPEAKELQKRGGHRTTLVTPLIREGIAIGAIISLRGEVRPFTENHIQLLKTFADQAVIALENVRLFQELTEALQQQTGTSEILGVIASSPTDIQPVLDAIAESAARLCGAYDAIIRLVEGDGLKLAAHFGPVDPGPSIRPISRGSVLGRAVIDRRLLHIEDLMAVVATEFPKTVISTERANIRTTLAVPLLREGSAIGAIHMRRTEVQPFTDKQIRLLETFANQAVIAIENVRLFQELEKKNRELDIANRHKSDFLARVSHDLRTPLNSIIGFTRLVLRRTEGQIPELQKENLHKVVISSEHLLNLINTLLDLAKVEAGRMEVFAESFRVDDVIHMVASTVEPMLKDGRVRLVREIASDIPPVHTDRDKLKQILLNLLSNAAKFTEQGEIKVSASRQDGTLKLTVADTGIGMKKDALDHIFEEFRQAEKSTSAQYGGTGLGLAIVKRLVNLLGGEIGVESEVAKGTTFSITLPIGVEA